MQIVLGITGGVAAYKAAELVRQLTNQGHRVRCILTEAGARFITPLALSSLTGEPCLGANPDMGEWRANPSVEHIELARWADLVVVAPATANSIGKTANGLAPDLLSTVLLATRAPVLWAPARASWPAARRARASWPM
jgi:phosphopantothenoylcysteine decarboxylase / phosphopantothenate---cysteine ligase